MRLIRLRKAIKIAVIVTVAVNVFSFIVMSLWNWVIPPVIGWHTLDYGQAFGLLLLSKILFGGFRGGGRGRWRPRMIDNWDQLTPEEREKFRSAMRRRCAPDTGATEPV